MPTRAFIIEYTRVLLPLVTFLLAYGCVELYFDKLHNFSWLWLPNSVASAWLAIESIEKNRKHVSVNLLIGCFFAYFAANFFSDGFSLNQLTFSAINTLEIALAGSVYREILIRLSSRNTSVEINKIAGLAITKLVVILSLSGLLASSYLHLRYGSNIFLGFIEWVLSILIAYVPMTLFVITWNISKQEGSRFRGFILVVIAYALSDWVSDAIVDSVFIDLVGLAVAMVLAVTLFSPLISATTILALIALELIYFNEHGYTAAVDNLTLMSAIILIELFAVFIGFIFARMGVAEFQLEQSYKYIKNKVITNQQALSLNKVSLIDYNINTQKYLGYETNEGMWVTDSIWRDGSEAFKGFIVEEDIREILGQIELINFQDQSVEYSVEYSVDEVSQRCWYRLAASSPYWVDNEQLITLARIDITAESMLSVKLQDKITQAESLITTLEDKQNRERQMFGVIGHELRTPIATLRMLLNEIKVETLEPHGQIVNDLVDHLLSVLNDLRAVVDSSHSPASVITSGQPANEINKAIDSLGSTFLANNISVNFTYDITAKSQMTGAFQGLRQLTTNLAKNAAVHSGGSELLIHLACDAIDNEDSLNCCVTFDDNGKGIATEVQTRLFGAFERGDTDSDGTGLGLFLSKEIAQQMGGDLYYEDSERGGSRFVLEFKMKAIDTDDSPAVSPSQHNNLVTGKRVLLAEDNATIALLTKTMLTKAGAEVFCAGNGEEALDAFTNGNYDFVLTDIFMPKMNGYQLVSAIRATGSTLPIIGVSAATVGEESETLIKQGANRVLSKPISIALLNEALRSL